MRLVDQYRMSNEGTTRSLVRVRVCGEVNVTQIKQWHLIDKDECDRIQDLATCLLQNVVLPKYTQHLLLTTSCPESQPHTNSQSLVAEVPTQSPVLREKQNVNLNHSLTLDLSMDGFTLPMDQSTSILKDGDLVRFTVLNVAENNSTIVSGNELVTAPNTKQTSPKTPKCMQSHKNTQVLTQSIPKENMRKRKAECPSSTRTVSLIEGDEEVANPTEAVISSQKKRKRKRSKTKTAVQAVGEVLGSVHVSKNVDDEGGNGVETKSAVVPQSQPLTAAQPYTQTQSCKNTNIKLPVQSPLCIIKQQTEAQVKVVALEEMTSKKKRRRSSKKSKSPNPITDSNSVLSHVHVDGTESDIQQDAEIIQPFIVNESKGCVASSSIVSRAPPESTTESTNERPSESSMLTTPDVLVDSAVNSQSNPGSMLNICADIPLTNISTLASSKGRIGGLGNDFHTLKDVRDTNDSSTAFRILNDDGDVRTGGSSKTSRKRRESRKRKKEKDRKQLETTNRKSEVNEVDNDDLNRTETGIATSCTRSGRGYTRQDDSANIAAGVPKSTAEGRNKRVRVNYDSLSLLEGTPRKGDLLVFKMMEMDDNYCPRLSKFKEGKVLAYDPNTTMVTIELAQHSRNDTTKPVREEVASFDWWYDYDEPLDRFDMGDEFAVESLLSTGTPHEISVATDNLLDVRLIT
eukprot:CFRG3984T1